MKTIKKPHMGDKNIKEIDIDMVPKNNHMHKLQLKMRGKKMTNHALKNSLTKNYYVMVE